MTQTATPASMAVGLPAPSRIHGALPYGIGHFTPRWGIAVLALLAMVAFGVYAYLQQAIHGELVSGLRTIGGGGAVWGIFIMFDVFFVGVSFGCLLVATIQRLFDVEMLRPFVRVAEILTVTCLVLAGCCVMADLGRPLHGLMNLPNYARPQSPFYGTFTMVVGAYLFASLVYLFLASRADAAWMADHDGALRRVYRWWSTGWRGTSGERQRQRQVSLWMSIFVMPLLITAQSTLGFIFGIQGGRPGWFSALQAPSFVVLAGVSGVGMLIVASGLVRWSLGLQNTMKAEAFRWLGAVLLVLVAVYGYFMVAEELTSFYAANEADRALARVIVEGQYQPLFVTMVGSLVVAFLLLATAFAQRAMSVWLTVAAGAVVQVAAVLKRYLVVVPSQTHGMLLPYPTGRYVPTWVELTIIAGMMALAALVLVVFAKFFPIVPVDGADRDVAAPPEQPRSRARLRLVLALGTLAAGAAVAAFGFAMSSRFGTLPFLDPVIPFAPVIFIVGMVLVFFSGAVYELVPAAPAPAGPRSPRVPAESLH